MLRVSVSVCVGSESKCGVSASVSESVSESG